MKVSLFSRSRRSRRSCDRNHRSHDTFGTQISPLYEENTRIFEILDWDRSPDPLVKVLKNLCESNNFNIWNEFIVNFVLRMNLEQIIVDLELHRFLILIESAASM